MISVLKSLISLLSIVNLYSLTTGVITNMYVRCRFSDGALLTVASVHWRPHTVLTTDAEGRLAVAGPMGNMLNVLAHSLNFT